MIGSVFLILCLVSVALALSFKPRSLAKEPFARSKSAFLEESVQAKPFGLVKTIKGKVASRDEFLKGYLSKQFTETPITVLSQMGAPNPHTIIPTVASSTKNKVEIGLIEYSYDDGSHGQETIGLMSASSGSHNALGGRVEAGKTSCTGQFKQVKFSTPFTQVPIIISTATGKEALTSRITSLTVDGFKLKLEREEKARPTAIPETDVNWMAFLPGQFPTYEAFTKEKVTHLETEFTWSIGDAKAVFSNMQTTKGGDTSFTLIKTLDIKGKKGTVLVGEETSANSEVAHTTETVGIVVIPSKADSTEIFAT